MAFSYYTPISINSGQVPSTQTDFPVLVSQTDNRFKTIANSGHVANSSGFDIRPYSDSGLTTALSYELERYNASTGEVVMWVKVASLSSSTTPIYLGYGDASLTTDGSSTATWSNSFTSVYHFGNGTTLSVADSLAAHNGTNHSATAVAGQIDGAASVALASSQYVDLGSWGATAALTYSAWVKPTFPTGGTGLQSIISRHGTTIYSILYLVGTGGNLAMAPTFYQAGGVGFCGYSIGTHTLLANTWYHIATTYDATNHGHAYVNGAADNPGAAWGTAALDTSAQNIWIGGDPNTAGRYFDGPIDEARIASVKRSADWIATEYNNQVAPGTFETLGTETAVVAGGTGSTGAFFQFF